MAHPDITLGELTDTMKPSRHNLHGRLIRTAAHGITEISPPTT